jgi:hypothetical protein
MVRLSFPKVSGFESGEDHSDLNKTRIDRNAGRAGSVGSLAASSRIPKMDFSP